MKRLRGIAWTVVGLLLVAATVIVVQTLRFRPAAPGERAALQAAPAIDVERAARRLGEAIRFRTVSTGADVARDEAQWHALHAWLASSYPGVHATLQREQIAGLTLLYTWPGADPTLAPIVLMAHQDVVPINDATLDDWTYPPFDGVVADGVVWGRGALDDKGGLVGLMEAAEALIASGFRPERTIMLLFGHDEEIGGEGVRQAVELLRARQVVPQLVLDEGFMVLADFPLTGRPAGVIGVAEKGYLTLKLTALATGGHSSMPPRNSGAVRLARAIVALEENQMAGSLEDPPIAELLRAVADDMPWLQRAVLANGWLFSPLVDAQLSALPSANALMRTTTAPTMLSGSVKDNVLPQAASALVNFRIHPRDSVASVTEHVRAVVAPFAIEVEQAPGVLRAEPSPIAPTDTHAYRTLEALADWVGQGAPVAPGLVLGATDARHFATLTPAAYRFMPVIGTPEEIAGFHGTDERLSVANVGRMVEGYARLMVTLAGPARSGQANR
jgi:carboxypeptidase PM20D1